MRNKPLFRALLSVFFSIATLFSFSSFAQSHLLSQKKPVSASSQEALFAPTSAVDGVVTTRWSSAFSDAQWIYVDLGAAFNIDRVVLNWETAYGKAYEIQLSNDAVTWTTVYSTATSDGGIDDLPLVGVGRYVRMQGVKRNTVWGYSLYEFQVYGTDPIVPAVTALASSQEAGLAPAYAIDNKTTTRWGSAFTASEWIYADLGANVAVSRVLLKWEGAYAKGYQLQVSTDALNWTTVYTTSTGDGGTDDVILSAPATARFVKMNGVTRATGYGYSLWEFQVYGDPTLSMVSSSKSSSSVGVSSSKSSSLVSSAISSSVPSTSASSSKSSASSAPVTSSSVPASSSSLAASSKSYAQKIFFVGNSFTYYGPVPKLVESMARYNGFSDVSISYRAISGATLHQHRVDTAVDSAPAQLQQGWDAVVLQDQSNRPTKSGGNPAGFYDDITWFYDYIKNINGNTKVYFYETWARRFDSTIYPTTFADPAQMQAELRFAYNDAATNYVPLHSQYGVKTPITVVPAGDAWELDLQNGEADGRLHDADSHHAGALGQYLNALMFYSMIFDRSAKGTLPLGGITEAQAAHLQSIADAVTKKTAIGVDGTAPSNISAGSTFLVDFGSVKADGWTPLKEGATAMHILSQTNAPSSINVTAWGFKGELNSGATTTNFGWPQNATSDSLWVGATTSHADALAVEARVAIKGLAAGNYKLELFGSANDGGDGLGRVTRFSVGSQYADLDAANNTSNSVTLNVAADAQGTITLRVAVSPDSASKQAVLNLMKISKL